ncbi:hypothetical protein BH23ACT12_BH23ACT12_17980 [soil metagenome]
MSNVGNDNKVLLRTTTRIIVEGDLGILPLAQTG